MLLGSAEIGVSTRCVAPSGHRETLTSISMSCNSRGTRWWMLAAGWPPSWNFKKATESSVGRGRSSTCFGPAGMRGRSSENTPIGNGMPASVLQMDSNSAMVATDCNEADASTRLLATPFSPNSLSQRRWRSTALRRNRSPSGTASRTACRGLLVFSAISDGTQS